MARIQSTSARVQSASSTCYACAHTALGWVLVAQSARGICAVFLGDSREAVQTELLAAFPEAKSNSSASAALHAVLKRVQDPTAPVDWPLDLGGTAFQKQVWLALQTIPPGTTISYSELAVRVGAPQAVRAVASACAANRLALVVPCHRVVRKDASLSGYRWSVARKRQLLAQEAALSTAA